MMDGWKVTFSDFQMLNQVIVSPVVLCLLLFSKTIPNLRKKYFHLLFLKVKSTFSILVLYELWLEANVLFVLICVLSFGDLQIMFFLNCFVYSALVLLSVYVCQGAKNVCSLHICEEHNCILENPMDGMRKVV